MYIDLKDTELCGATLFNISRDKDVLKIEYKTEDKFYKVCNIDLTTNQVIDDCHK